LLHNQEQLDGEKGVGDVEAADALTAGMVSMKGGEAAAAEGPTAPKMFSDD
jgi:hypothetical protein